ncbi:MAG: DNA repair protein RadC [SAR324 cluster bacterium]|nr:DNA repair protein RadC [SAR324 cluster bacterium]
MEEFEFFNQLKQYFNKQPFASDFDRYVNSFSEEGLLNRTSIYNEFLELLLQVLNIPSIPGSCRKELRPLFQLIQKIDSRYYTKAEISEEIGKCYTLTSDQQQEIQKRLIMFFDVLCQSHFFSGGKGVSAAEEWDSWFRILPEGHAWDIMKIFQSFGIQVCASWPGYRAWFRFNHGANPIEKSNPGSWQELCEKWIDGEEQLKIYPDLLSDGFAGALSHLGIEGFCGETPDCSRCPLQTSCSWKNTVTETLEESVLLKIQKERFHEISTQQLLNQIFSTEESELPSLDHFFEEEQTLRSMEKKSVYELGQVQTQIPHFGEKFKALLELCKRYNEEKLIPGEQFSSSADIFRHFRFRLRALKQEYFILVLLDNKHQYLTDSVVSKGTLNKSLVHPREVFSTAIENRAAAIICVHNHPSGDPAASPDDIQITRRLVEVGRVVGIPLLDHVIVGNDRYFSLADEGLL